MGGTLIGGSAVVGWYLGSWIDEKFIAPLWNQEERLRKHEIKKLKEANVDPEQLKKDITGQRKTGYLDLFKNKKTGEICVKHKKW